MTKRFLPPKSKPSSPPHHRTHTSRVLPLPSPSDRYTNTCTSYAQHTQVQEERVHSTRQDTMSSCCSAVSTAARASQSPLLLLPSRQRSKTTTPSACRTRRLLRVHRRRGSAALRASKFTETADSDDDQEPRVLEVSSKKELDDLVSAGASGGKLVVLEVRREKGSPASEAFAPKFSSMAADFAHDAVFAKYVSTIFCTW